MYLASVIAFIIVLAVVVYKEWNSFERQSILLLRRTQKGKAFIIRLGTSHPTFWKWLGNAGIAVGFFFSVWTIWLLLGITGSLFTTPGAQPGLSLVLPSPTADTVIAPGVLGVPFWNWIISIALLVVFHEGFHGIIAAREKVKIQSLGLGLLLVIPLAFVEPDEKQLRKKPAMAQMRVFAAGSFANFLIAGAAILVTLAMLSAFFIPAGAGIVSLQQGFPAYEQNVTGVITAVNGNQITNIDSLSKAFASISPGQQMQITTKLASGEARYYTLTAAADPDGSPGAYIGVNLVPVRDINPKYSLFSGVINFGEGLLYFIFLINLGVGAFNLMPIRGLDGGRMWELVFRRVSRKHYGKLMNIATYLIVLILLINFSFAFARFF